MTKREPIFNVPRGVLWASAVMVLVQLVVSALPEETALNVIQLLAFIPARYSGLAGELPGGYAACVTSFVTYMIVHAGWVHLMVNLAWMVAFGSGVERRIGEGRFFAFSILCGIAGALTHLAFHFGDTAPVVGASAAISGQMAAALRLVFGARPTGPKQSGVADFVNADLPSVAESLKDPRMLLILALWVVLNLIFGLGAVSIGGVNGPIAWEAHVGGFLFGLFFFGFFDRPHATHEATAPL